MFKSKLAVDGRPAVRTRAFLALLALASLSVAACNSDSNEPQQGELEVVVTVTGEGADADGFAVEVDGTQVATVGATGGTISADALAAGNHEVELTGLDANCTVTGGAVTRTVAIVADNTTEITYAVTCAAAV